MLSPFVPTGRAFGRAEVESFFLRSRGEWQFLSLLNGDVIRYFSPPPDTGGEQMWFLHAEARWQRWPSWRVAWKADGFLQDTVIDLSETEAVRTVLAARVRGGFTSLAPRFVLPGGLALEPLAQVKRVDYNQIPGDYDETRTGLRLEWKRTPSLALSAAWLEYRRRFDARQNYTAGGRALPGTHLRFWLRDGELKATTTWGTAGRWTAAAAVGRLANRDRASGFFDYDQKRLRAELEWRGAAWKIHFEGAAKRLDYLIQTVGAGTAPPPRITDSFDTRLRVERSLGPGWLLFAEHTWERSRSNEREFTYRANTALAGLQRDF
jgi:hypothetical protein